MRKVKIIIGANFGDEGKGLATDYFCSRFPSHQKVLNVRFNGGAQAGHTVVTPEGRRHVFHHFGSGSFLPNVATYLSKDFIVNPILFRREYEELQSIGIYPMIYVHPKCLVTLPQDMMVNQFLEVRRDQNRHGSCGIGIFETIIRSRLDRPFQVCSINGFPGRLGLDDLDFDYYSSERMEKVLGVSLSNDEKAMMTNQNIWSHYRIDTRFMLDHITIADEGIFKLFDYAVFEGAQGLMLDQNNLDYFPHLTPSNTGATNILPYLDGLMDVEVCYVTRPYLTRHGAGKLPNECLRESFGIKPDLTNVENEWQGSLRYGKMDWIDFKDRCEKDYQNIFDHGIRLSSFSVIVTHMDDRKEWEDGFVSDRMGDDAVEVLAPVDRLYASYGPTRKDIQTIYDSTALKYL